MYSRFINQNISQKYKELCEITSLMEEFFSHITSTSFELKDLLINKEYDINIEQYYYDHLTKYSFTVPTLSIIVLCKNEERCIRRCLESIYEQVQIQDEIIVLDTGSIDNSLDIIKLCPYVKLYQTEWRNDFAAIRNEAMRYACNDWIFFIDADELLEKGALDIAKSYLAIIDWLQIQPVVVAPKIINSDFNVFQGVRRIIKNDHKLHYTGLVHEELRLDDEKLGTDVRYISFDNIILYHDGYIPIVMKEKNKLERYSRGMWSMIDKEPTHPRWLYFLCRDGKNTLPLGQYESHLKKVIELSNRSIEFRYYKIKAISDLLFFYVQSNNKEQIHTYLEMLKTINPNSSDIIYFSTLTKYNQIKEDLANTLNELVNYRNQNTCLDYGSIHSNCFHIDSVIALLFFEMREYKKAFSLYKKLEDVTAGDYHSSYFSLYCAINDFFCDYDIEQIAENR